MAAGDAYPTRRQRFAQISPAALVRRVIANTITHERRYEPELRYAAERDQRGYVCLVALPESIRNPDVAREVAAELARLAPTVIATLEP